MPRPCTFKHLLVGDEGCELLIESIAAYPAGDNQVVAILTEPLAPEDVHMGGLWIYLLEEEPGYDESWEDKYWVAAAGWNAGDLDKAKRFAAHLSGTLNGHNLDVCNLP